ncbi:MAG: FHA domain-containing protein [Halofilum sp. (in: g-proteobacteria)]|nr:FHA domain-containing protein [Halofilum sp. (in: g-proteobacteria)]
MTLRDEDRGIATPVYRLPVTIGRGNECDVALDGAGPDGVYARMVAEEYGLVLERIRPAARMAVNRDDVDRAVLSNGDALYIDDRVFTLDWHELAPNEQPARTRNRRLATLMGLGTLALAGVIGGGAFLMDLLAPDVQAPTAEQVPALDIERTNRLNPLAEALAGAADWQPEHDRDVDLTDVESSLPPTALIDRVRASWDKAYATPAEAAPDSSAQTAPEPAPARPDVGAIGAAARGRGMRLYRDGAGERAARTMREVAQRSVMTGTPEARGLRWLAGRVDHGLDLYGTARGALGRDRLMVADERLDELAALEEEDLDLAEPSVYYNRLRGAVVDAMAASMHGAADAGKNLEAYRWADELLALREHEEARALQRRLDQKAAERFDFAYRLEPVDLGNAARVWREITDIVPEHSRWHRQAVAKLEQYRMYRE